MCKRKCGLIFLILIVIFFNSAYMETVKGDLNARFSDVLRLEYNGEVYRIRNRTTGILLIGVDKDQNNETKISMRNGGQADFLLLLVIDDDNDTITPVQINRDTISEFSVLSILGEVIGTNVGQICLSHGFGDGKEQSCELTVDAVSNLLFDIPIEYYISMNADSIAYFNDLIGGVEVTLEDDFSAYDTEMLPGKTMILNGKQAEYYLRYRYNVGEQTNISRLSRQRIYIEKAEQILYNRIQQSSGFAEQFYEEIRSRIITNATKGYLVNTANKIRTYTLTDIREIYGSSQVGSDGYMEFYPDRDLLKEMVIDLFFEKDH